MPSAEARSRRSLVTVWWTVGFVVMTTTGLGLLTWALLGMHALTYGTFEILRPQAGVPAPELDNYVRAFLVGATVNVAVAFGMVGLANTSRARGWHPVAVAVIAALAAAGVAGSASLLMLGINPVSFLFAL